MTRAERAAEAEARLKEQRDEISKQIAREQATQRVEEKKARDKRRHRVGKLVDDAGLFALSDRSLARLFETLRPLLPIPNPDIRLGRLLARAPLTQWAQEAAEVDTEVQALIAQNVTLVFVDDDSQPVCGPPVVGDGLAHPADGVSPAC